METSLNKQVRGRRIFPNFYLILFSFVIFLKIMFTIFFISPSFFWAPGVVISFGLFFVPFSFIFLFSKKKAWICWYVLNFFTSLLLLSDCLYYSYFQSPFSIYTILQFNNLSGLGESILHVLEIKYLLLFLDLFIFPFVYKQVDLKLNRKMFALLFLSGLIVWLSSPLKNFQSDDNTIFRRFDNRDSYNYFGPIGYHILDTLFFIKNRNKDLTFEEKAVIQKWYEKKNNNLSDPTLDLAQKYKGIGKGKNLIIIQVESLQNFVINQTVNKQEITPHLNKLLHNSLYFTNFYPQTIQGNSSDAEFLINTSLYPLEKGSVYFRYPNNKYNSLPVILKNEGYDPFAIHADEASFWNRSQVYPNLGFNEFYDIRSFNLDEEIGMGLSDYSMFKQSIEILEKKDKPYYSFIITLTSHMPFIIPDRNKLLPLPDSVNISYLYDYFQSVRYTDETIGMFINELEKKNMLHDSIIVIYGDHDGIFEDNKPLVEKWKNQPISSEEWVRQYTNIPFIIYNPSLNGESIDTVGGQIDVLPTLLHIMGIDEEKINHSAMGNNLLAREEGTTLVPGGGYIKRSTVITQDQIHELDEQHVEALNVSRLIIEGNFFK